MDGKTFEIMMFYRSMISERKRLPLSSPYSKYVSMTNLLPPSLHAQKTLAHWLAFQLQKWPVS